MSTSAPVHLHRGVTPVLRKDNTQSTAKETGTSPAFLRACYDEGEDASKGLVQAQREKVCGVEAPDEAEE